MPPQALLKVANATMAVADISKRGGPQRPGPPAAGAVNAADKAQGGVVGGNNKQLSCAQRIEAATATKQQILFSEVMTCDAEALFRKYDTEKTQLICRGVHTELLRDIGLDEVFGDTFLATSQLLFDAQSADSHFLSLAEFKHLYYYISHWYPTILPREPALSITIMCAKDLPAMDIGGKSDPFCTLQCCKLDAKGKVLEYKPWSKSQTKIIEKTLSPWWGEEFTDWFGYEEGDGMAFIIYDYDKGEKSELIGRAVLQGSEFDKPGGFHGSLPIQLQVPDAPKGLQSTLTVRVTVKGQPMPPSRLQVVVHSASGLPPADNNGKSDPFLIFHIAGKPSSRAQTKIVAKSLDPVWNETFDGKYCYDDGDRLMFEVRDYDGKVTKPELLGRCILANEAFAKIGGFSGEIPLVDVARGTVPAPGGKAYTPKIKVTVTLADMMPPPEEAAPAEAAEAPAEVQLETAIGPEAA